MPLKQSTINFDDLDEVANQSIQEPVSLAIAENETLVEIEVPFISQPAGYNAGHGNAHQKKSQRGRMKLSAMDACVQLVEVPDDEVLFEKRYYSIGAVSAMFKVNPSLIRFWENEFDILKPKKNGKGDRFFRPEDVKSLQLIYSLLRERKYTIEGAKDFLKKNKKVDEKFTMIESLKKLKGFLNELKASL